MPPDSADEVSPHVRLRIEKELKREWLEFLDESNQYTTLTDLITTSVNNTINEKWVLVSDEEDASVPNDLNDSIESISSRLEVIETQLDDATLGESDPADQELSEQELLDLARVCHDNLPVVQNGDHLRDLTTLYPVKLSVDMKAKVTGTAQDISAHINKPVGQVRNALIYLERQETGNVESIVHEGTRRWFEKDPTADRDPELSQLELEDKVVEDVEFVSAEDLRDNES